MIIPFEGRPVYFPNHPEPACILKTAPRRLLVEFLIESRILRFSYHSLESTVQGSKCIAGALEECHTDQELADRIIELDRDFDEVSLH